MQLPGLSWGLGAPCTAVTGSGHQGMLSHVPAIPCICAALEGFGATLTMGWLQEGRHQQRWVPASPWVGSSQRKTLKKAELSREHQPQRGDTA